MPKKKPGWCGESQRHALAAKGVKTGQRDYRKEAARAVAKEFTPFNNLVNSYVNEKMDAMHNFKSIERDIIHRYNSFPEWRTKVLAGEEKAVALDKAYRDAIGEMDRIDLPFTHESYNKELTRAKAQEMARNRIEWRMDEYGKKYAEMEAKNMNKEYRNLVSILEAEKRYGHTDGSLDRDISVAEIKRIHRSMNEISTMKRHKSAFDEKLDPEAYEFLYARKKRA